LRLFKGLVQGGLILRLQIVLVLLFVLLSVISFCFQVIDFFVLISGCWCPGFVAIVVAGRRRMSTVRFAWLFMVLLEQ
jgi:hypothetical protein